MTPTPPKTPITDRGGFWVLIAVGALLLAALVESGSDSPATDNRAIFTALASDSPAMARAKTCANAIWHSNVNGLERSNNPRWGNWGASKEGVIFHDVEYYDKAGRVLCTMDGNTVTGLSWQDPHSGQIRLLRTFQK